MKVQPFTICINHVSSENRSFILSFPNTVYISETVGKSFSDTCKMCTAQNLLSLASFHWVMAVMIFSNPAFCASFKHQKDYTLGCTIVIWYYLKSDICIKTNPEVHIKDSILTVPLPPPICRTSSLYKY